MPDVDTRALGQASPSPQGSALAHLATPKALAAIQRQATSLDRARDLAFGDGALQRFIASQSAAAKISETLSRQFAGSATWKLAHDFALEAGATGRTFADALGKETLQASKVFEQAKAVQSTYATLRAQSAAAGSIQAGTLDTFISMSTLHETLGSLAAAASIGRLAGPLPTLTDALTRVEFAPYLDLWDPPFGKRTERKAGTSSETHAAIVIETIDLLDELEWVLPRTVTDCGRTGLDVLVLLERRIESNVAHNFVQLVDEAAESLVTDEQALVVWCSTHNSIDGSLLQPNGRPSVRGTWLYLVSHRLGQDRNAMPREVMAAARELVEARRALEAIKHGRAEDLFIVVSLAARLVRAMHLLLRP